MKKKLLLTAIFCLASVSALASEADSDSTKKRTEKILGSEAVENIMESTNEDASVKDDSEFKHWYIKSGINRIDRQSGRQTGKAYEDGYPGADDLIEDGDVTSIFTNLGYKINEKWAVDYTYSYDYIDNNEQFGKDGDKDTGQYINHTFRLIRSFDPFNLMGKSWDSSVWLGYRNYRESSIDGSDGSGYNYHGFSSDRLLANANMNTDLTEKTHLDLNYNYQFRQYNNDGGGSDPNNQHRHYLTATINHDFNDAWYVNIENTLYLRQEVSDSRNYGEWDYNYTLGNKYPLANGYVLNTELTAWGELAIWEKGRRERDDHNQAEIVAMPKIKKEFKLEEDMTISGFVGAGYVYGYDTQTNRKMYSGFESRLGAVYSYNF